MASNYLGARLLLLLHPLGVPASSAPLWQPSTRCRPKVYQRCGCNNKQSQPLCAITAATPWSTETEPKPKSCHVISQPACHEAAADLGPPLSQCELQLDVATPRRIWGARRGRRARQNIAPEHAVERDGHSGGFEGAAHGEARGARTGDRSTTHSHSQSAEARRPQSRREAAARRAALEEHGQTVL